MIRLSSLASSRQSQPRLNLRPSRCSVAAPFAAPRNLIHKRNFANSSAVTEKNAATPAVVDEHEVISSLEGTPARELERTVIIARPTKSSMQSGLDKYSGWRLYWLREEIWANPLMGWTSTRDPFTNLRLRFDTKEAAVAYARQHGLRYEVREEHGWQLPPTPGKMYGEHFKYIPPPQDPFEF